MDPELRKELQTNFRKEVFDVLTLISSKEEQLEYQEKVPIAYVSAELFNLWDSCYQTPKNQDWYVEAFSDEELNILQEFDIIFEEISESTPDNPPDIHEFVETSEWKKLSDAATVAFEKLSKSS
jgi:hypothetical protein